MSTAASQAADAIVVRFVGPQGEREQTFEAARGVTIGRESHCSIILAGREVSRQHATIRVGGPGLELLDQSANGTVVDGIRIHRQAVALTKDSVISIGPFRLQAWTTHLSKRLRVETAPPPTNRRTDRVSPELRRQLHDELVEHLDLVKLERARMNPALLRAKVNLALEEITEKLAHLIPKGTDVPVLIRELADEAVGLGPLENMLADQSISEIMVVDPQTIYVERNGQIELTAARFTDTESVRSTLERIATPLGRRIDESSPMLDARLADGSRVNAVIPPLAIRGPCITIRKFSKEPLELDDLLRYGSLNQRMANFLIRSVIAKRNIIISGGTGSGKTTLLNVLSAYIPENERIVTIEDSAELQLQQSHVVSLEGRPPNMEGRGEISIRDLVKNAMRMRPDRVVVGECRGGEALDMLQAMNTGHDGSMTTTHANNPEEALKRIETLALMSGLDLPSRAVREQIANAVHLLVQQTRFSDGSRRIISIAEVVGLEDDGVIEVREIFGFRRERTTADGKVHGSFYATGYLPSYIAEFIPLGLVREGEDFL